MKVYNYDPATLEFTGVLEADESPAEPGVFLIPAYATTEAVPDSIEGQSRFFIGTKWEQRANVVPVEAPPAAPPVAPVIDPQTLAADARARRNQLLKMSDWRMLPDVFDPATFDHIKDYRKALRELPKQPDFPTVINWPELV